MLITRDYRTQHRWAISRDLVNQATYFKLKSLNKLKIQLRIVLEQLNLLHIIFKYILNKTSYWSDLGLSMLAFKFKLKLVGSILNNYPITYSYSLQVHRKGLWNLAQVCLIAGPRPLNLRLFWAESLFKEPKVQEVRNFFRLRVELDIYYKSFNNVHKIFHSMKLLRIHQQMSKKCCIAKVHIKKICTSSKITQLKGQNLKGILYAYYFRS